METQSVYVAMLIVSFKFNLKQTNLALNKGGGVNVSSMVHGMEVK